MKTINAHFAQTEGVSQPPRTPFKMLCRLAILLLSLSTVKCLAADVTVYDSVVSLATNGTENYTFTDSLSGQSVVIAVTMSPYSPSDPSAVFSLLDGNTRVGVDSANGMKDGAGVNFSATLVSASGGVTNTSIAFRVAGLGIRPVDGGGDLTWNSSSTSTSITYTNSNEIVQPLDTATFSLGSGTYSAQLRFPGDALFQLTDVPASGQSVVLEATFAVGEIIDPHTNSWITAYSSRYARVYTNDVMKTNGTTLTTWSNGSMSQTNPVYCGVQEVYSSSNWVYVRTTGLGIHTMGPWYNDATRIPLFVNFPLNQKTLIRFPRNPAIPSTKSTVNGQGGYFVDGVCMFDALDAVSYINSTGQDGSAPGGTGSTGDGIWNRDAYVNEAITFDPALAHQQNTGVYHYHANPIATRYLLGDHVDFNSTNKIYSESTNAPTKHSPIVGWADDGFPLYGPYGYSNSTNAASGVRRIVSGFVLRNGQDGTANLTAIGRIVLPAWAARMENRSTTLLTTEYGPNVSTSFPLGRYSEDNDFLGDLTNSMTGTNYQQGTDFDLDVYNGRYCVTPEFPGGTYAYFVSITSNGVPNYPYNIGRQFYGNPTGGTVTSIGETVTTNFLGGTNLISRLSSPSVNSGAVTISWSATEGGKYQVERSTNLSSWTVLATNLSPSQMSGAYTNTPALDKSFYRVARTSVTNFDSAGTTLFAASTFAPGGSGTHGSTVLMTITLPGNPPNPPIDKIPASVAISGVITNTSNISRISTNMVQALFSIPSGAPLVTTNVMIIFSPAPTYTLTNGFTVN